VQAILRWDHSDGITSKGPKISTQIKYPLLIQFRVLQHCRSWEEWPATKECFLHAAHDLIVSQGDTISSDEDTDHSSTDGEEGSTSQNVPLPKHRLPVPRLPQATIEAQWMFIKTYFCEHWFTDEWIRKYMISYLRINGCHVWQLACFTDIGMPVGQTRDGTWNVNNWTERSFLLFDTIFLDNWRNKR
jgi:hypothetical protein